MKNEVINIQNLLNVNTIPMKLLGINFFMINLFVIVSCEDIKHYNVDEFTWSDTIYSDNQVFFKDRIWEYRIKYEDVKISGFLFGEVTMKCTGDIYNNQIEYELLYNQEIKEDGWVSKSTTGAIDSKESLIIHPIRHNHYRAAELAPFPILCYPLVIGSTWENSISVGHGWENYEGQIAKSTYEVIDVYKSNYYFELMDEVWEISATSTCNLGLSSVKLFYNKKYGFIEMKYNLFNGDKMHVVLNSTNF